MNTIQEAMSKAGINSEDFVENEKNKFSGFPFKVRQRGMLTDKVEYMDETYKYKRQFRSKPLQAWVNKQDYRVINFLRENKERVYVFPKKKCEKFLEAWIGYNTKYQRFVIRLNSQIMSYAPFRMNIKVRNMFAGNFAKAVKETILDLHSEDTQITQMMRYVDILNEIPSNKFPEIIMKTFANGIIPVEQFDPLVELGNIVQQSMITAESTNLDQIRAELGQLEEKDHLLSSTKIHINTVELYCFFNNIRPIDISGSETRRTWVNLIFAKDTKNVNRKDGINNNKSFFLIL